LTEELATSFKGGTVVITHHAPSGICNSPEHRQSRLAPAYASNLDELVMDSKAVAWISGHTHYPIDVTLGDTRLISNPRGYAYVQEANFNPGFVLDL
jgi:hypothetical protein